MVQRTGFSTGALERGNFRKAVSWMESQDIRVLELSALRYEELRPLMESLNELRLSTFTYISVHAPSSFPREKEEEVVNLLSHAAERDWNVIVHPNVIYTPSLWRRLRKYLLIENMDGRKHSGRTAKELENILIELPEARLCLDVAHARQLDTTLTLLWEIVLKFADRIAEVHISELDSLCRHRPMSNGAVCDYRRIAPLIRADAPVVIESVIESSHSCIRIEEISLAADAFGKSK